MSIFSKRSIALSCARQFGSDAIIAKSVHARNLNSHLTTQSLPCRGLWLGCDAVMVDGILLVNWKTIHAQYSPLGQESQIPHTGQHQIVYLSMQK